MTVLVTGGAGYVGSTLVHFLDDRGHEIRVMDDFSLSSPRNLIAAPALEFVRGDIRDPDAVDAAMEGVESVIHLAAITGAERSHEMRDRVVDVNAHGSETLLAAAEAASVDRLVFASSCNVYGDGTNWRPFMHVRDTARTLVDALDLDPGLYNVAHDNYRIGDIVETVERVVDRPVETDYLADRDPGPSYHVDCGRVREQGFTTGYDLETGIRNLVDRFGRFDGVRRPVAER